MQGVDGVGREDAKQPLITIGIPTFNRADSYFPLALESARAQTYPNIEIVVCDNCSTDSTRSLVQSIPDERVRYHRQTARVTANENFNSCLQLAKGSYFLLLNDDDVIDPEFVQSCVHALAGREVGIVRTGVRTIDGAGRVLREYPNAEEGLSALRLVERWLGGRVMLILCSTLFNTRLLREMGGFGSPHGLFQDVVAELGLAAHHGRIDVAEVRASFRKHQGQRTNAGRIREWVADSLYLLDFIRVLFPQHASALTRLGTVHFAKHNYDLARDIPGFGERYSAYWRIYAAFGFRYSPMRFHFGKVRRRVLARLGKLKRYLLGQERRATIPG